MAIIKKCLVCENEFKGRNQTSKVCSVQCANKLKIKDPLIKKCPCCGKEFTKLNKEIIFCSQKCSGASRSNKSSLNCKVCNKEFLATPSQIKNEKKYCSKKCLAIANSERMREKDKKEEDRFCAVCEKKLDTSKNYGKSITCSHKCGAIHRFSPRMHVDMNAAINRFLNGQIDLDPALIIPDNKIEGIFNLSLINSMNIGDDVTVFSIKK